MQAQVEAKVLTWAWEMPVMVIVAGMWVEMKQQLSLALSLSKYWVQLGPIFLGLR